MLKCYEDRDRRPDQNNSSFVATAISPSLIGAIDLVLAARDQIMDLDLIQGSAALPLIDALLMDLGRILAQVI